MKILKAARALSDPDGTLLIAEPITDTAGAEAMGGAYFGFYLLAMGGGRPRTLQHLRALLQQAGFAELPSAADVGCCARASSLRTLDAR